MGYWQSRGLRGNALEELINITNEMYREKTLALIQKVPTPITPINIDLLSSLLQDYERIVTIEDHVLIGGFGSIISEGLQAAGIYKKYTHFGYKTGLIEHGKVDILLQKEGLTPSQIGETLINILL